MLSMLEKISWILRFIEDHINIICFIHEQYYLISYGVINGVSRYKFLQQGTAITFFAINTETEITLTNILESIFIAQFVICCVSL